jgi:lipoyl(octanoyl) transferase
MKPLPEVIFKDCGNISYAPAWQLQEELLQIAVQQKVKNRTDPNRFSLPIQYLLFCEHKPVYTLGKSGKQENLLMTQEELNINGIEYFPINRGGDITYHGPGQITGYPIFDLEQFTTDINIYLRNLEEAIIRTLAIYSIPAARYPGLTGVWIEPEIESRARKICAMGIRCSRWVTMHGFAFNVNTDLSYFNNIIPCGISDKAVTSMQQELGVSLNMEEVKHHLQNEIAFVFGFIYSTPAHAV